MSVKKLDYNAIWQEALNKSSLEWWKEPVKFWDKRAIDFSKMPRHDGRAKKIINNLSIKPEDTILDIGAGSGALAIPFAEYAQFVTALEPSGAMLKSLKGRIDNENLNNIACLQKKWEEVEPGKDFEEHDIVIASYSLSMFNMQKALLKMHNTAQKGVCIFTFAGGIAGSQIYKELWQLIYGEEYQGSPDYIYIYNILYQMGILANVTVEHGLIKQQYNNLEEAVNRWQDTMNAYNEDAAEIIEDYMQEKLTENNGKVFLKKETCTAMIWWENHKY